MKWDNPIYTLRAHNGKVIKVDVTTSCGPGLKPNRVFSETIIPFLKSKGIETILDFGAGSLRHTLPLLKRGFKVWAVEFAEQFKRPFCQKALAHARRSANFSALIFPGEFERNKRKFDAALLSFVVPTMPIPKERTDLLGMINDRLKRDSILFWMSQYGKYGNALNNDNRVNDGWYLPQTKDTYSFYTEFKNDQIDTMLSQIHFRKIRIPSESGHDQFRLYSKGAIKWP